MKWFGNLIWGLVFIAIGLIWAINSLGIADINIFFAGWWTLFIIVPSLVGLIKGQNRTWSILWLAIGVTLLLTAQGIYIARQLFVPIVFVIIGLSIIFHDAVGKTVRDKIKNLNKDGLEEYGATFGGQKVVLQNDEFKNASLSAVFGGVEFDIRSCNVQNEQVIDASAIFGGVEIWVPQNVNVKVKSTPIFGGVSNKTIRTNQENMPTLYINALCMFGGVDIK